MDELQTSLENARYHHAVNETGPRPLSAFTWPSDADIQKFVSDAISECPTALDPERVCEDSLGFYLFLQYVEERGHSVLAQFIRECAVYRRVADGMRLEYATEILTTYLLCKYSVNSNHTWSSTLRRKLCNHTCESIDSGCYFDPEESTNCICIKGAPYDHVLMTIERAISRRELQGLPWMSSRASESTNEDASGHISTKSDEVRLPMRRNSNRVEDIRSVIYNNTNMALASNNGSVARGGGARVGMDTIERLDSVDSEVDMEEKKIDANAGEHEEISKLLPADLFDVLDHIVFDQLKRYCEGFKASRYFATYIRFLILSQKKVTIEDFFFMRPIGRGGFGFVFACKRRTTGKVYAIKEMCKARIRQRGATNLVKNEKEIMAKIVSPFVLGLKYSFHDVDNLYIVTDLMMGGDLAYHLKKFVRFPPHKAKYYAARALLGVQALHSAGIIYRDLKPDNILMNEMGETKLIDLGLATMIDPDGLVQICGTRGYWAPDIIRRSNGDKSLRYSESADWFSFGCCIYEFLAGFSPFMTPTGVKWQSIDAMCSSLPPVDQAILEMNPEYNSRYFEPVVIDLLEKLLNKDGNLRLGALGAQEIKEHPWFSDINWNAMESGKIFPPFVPGRDMNLQAQSDIGVFNDNETRNAMEQQLNEDEFESWDHISKEAFFSEVVECMRYEETWGPLIPVTEGGGQCCSVS